MQAERTPRRTHDGGLIVPVDDLEVGDRLRLHRKGERLGTWWDIVRIDETPKSRRVFVDFGVFAREAEVGLLRRTTMIARAPRKDER